MIKKNIHYRPTQGTLRNSHRIIAVTRHQKEKQSKASSSLFPIKMIAKHACIEFESNQCTNDLAIVSTSAKGQTVAIIVSILVKVTFNLR